jgi:hypothetical protein
MSSKSIVDVQEVDKERSSINRVRIAHLIALGSFLTMKGSQASEGQKFHNSVYVVLLDNAVAKHPSILRANPKRDPLKPCAM